MAHEHSVYDTDKHFKIDIVTKAILAEANSKLKLMQYDHNSERYTFEIPRYVDGHDMSSCNKVMMHFNNIDAVTKAENKDVYRAEDVQVSPDDEEVVIFSFLITRSATVYAGTLNFIIEFLCVPEDGTIEYAWHTDIFTNITVGKGIHNTEVIIEESKDLLEQWKNEVIDAVSVDWLLSSTSTNPVQNKVLYAKFNELEGKVTNDAVNRALCIADRALKKGRITSDGVLEDNITWYRTDYIPVNTGMLVFSGTLTPPSQGYINIAAYDADKNFISAKYTSTSSNEMTLRISITEDIKYLVISTRVTSFKLLHGHETINSLYEEMVKKVSNSGHSPNKYLGTDDEGNVVEKDAPETGGGDIDLSGYATKEEVEELEQEIDDLNVDLGNDSSYLFQSVKQQNRAILNIEFEQGGIDASNGIIVEYEKGVRTKDFIDLSFYDEFIFNNLRQYAYEGNVVYYNDDKSYNSYTPIGKFQRDTVVNKNARYIKIVITEVYADTYPISDWSKYFYFEGVVNKKTDEKIDSFISNVYKSLAVDNVVTLSNSIDKAFRIETAVLENTSTVQEKSYIFDVKPYERYNISLKSFLKSRRALVVLTDNNEKPYKIFTRGEDSSKNYEASVEIPSYITKMYVMSTDGNLPVVQKQELKRLTSEDKNTWNGKKAVFLGDSITAGSWYNPTLKTWENMTENWTYWVSKLCGMTYKNYGIGDTHVSSAYNSGDGSKAEQAFTNRYSNMDDDADVVFVMGGTNDWLPDHTDTAPFGNISDSTDISFCGAIRVLCEGLIKKYNGKQIFFLTPICNANQLSANPTTGKTLKEYCDAITEICGMYSIEVINTHVNAPLHFMIAENANKYCSQQDGSTHPNDLGQKLLGEYIARVIS